jgi:hypothetical protein
MARVRWEWNKALTGRILTQTKPALARQLPAKIQIVDYGSGQIKRSPHATNMSGQQPQQRLPQLRQQCKL